MNLARLFSYTLEIEHQRDELRRRIQQLESDQKQLIDSTVRNAGKQEVFNRPEPVKQSSVPSVAFGPTAVGARQAAKEQEKEERILERAEQARGNGNIQAPTIPPE